MTTGEAPDLPRIAGLDAARGVRLFAGMRDIYLEALQDFVQLYSAGLPQVDAYLEAPSPEGLERARREVHGLGGAAAALGATEVERRAQEFEAVLRQPAGTAGDPARPLAALRDELAALVRGLKAPQEGA